MYALMYPILYIASIHWYSPLSTATSMSVCSVCIVLWHDHVNGEIKALKKSSLWRFYIITHMVYCTILKKYTGASQWWGTIQYMSYEVCNKYRRDVIIDVPISKHPTNRHDRFEYTNVLSWFVGVMLFCYCYHCRCYWWRRGQWWQVTSRVYIGIGTWWSK